MKINSVSEPAFRPYGCVLTCAQQDENIAQLLAALQSLPIPGGVEYIAADPMLEALSAACWL